MSGGESLGSSKLLSSPDTKSEGSDRSYNPSGTPRFPDSDFRNSSPEWNSDSGSRPLSYRRWLRENAPPNLWVPPRGSQADLPRGRKRVSRGRRSEFSSSPDEKSDESHRSYRPSGTPRLPDSDCGKSSPEWSPDSGPRPLSYRRWLRENAPPNLWERPREPVVH